MSDGAQTLHELIRQFEVPPSDAAFPELVAALGRQAVRRADAGGAASSELHARYFYLLARAYELLGYTARHTLWLSNSPLYYWRKAAEFLEEARLLTPPESSYHSFLHGKHLLRDAMIVTHDAKIAESRENTNLAQAETLFRESADAERDDVLRSIYLDLAAISRTEERHRRFMHELRTRLAKLGRRPSASTLAVVKEHLDTFPPQQFWDFPSGGAATAWPVQRALAKARQLYARSHLLEEVVASIRDAQKKQDDDTFAADFLKACEESILRCLEEAAAVCGEAGLTIRAADSRVALLRRKAEASLRHCIIEFKVVTARDRAERAKLLQHSGPHPLLLPAAARAILEAIHPDQDPARVPAELLQAAESAGLPLDDQAIVFAESTTAWIIRNGSDRYLVRAAELPEVTDLHKLPIPFDHSEARIFNDYSRAVYQTCELYTFAIREIHRVLTAATGWYEEITARLAGDAVAARNDAHLASMHTTISSILQELKSHNYPLLATLVDRRRYAWSLLEMFQMRNRSVRLGTLFSGQCQLIMANPFYDADVDVFEDKILEVGADPIFHSTVDFLFRGAKGDKNRYEFQRRALKTTRITIDQQEQSLLEESRYLDLDPSTRRALIARLACHRSLVLALEDFTPIFKAQRAGEIKTGTIRRLLDEIRGHFNAAEAALEAAGDYPSKLMDGAGLDAIHEYMKGIGNVLIGMNDRDQKRQWVGSYRAALGMLRRARKSLEDAGDVYLLPRGVVRDEYLRYVDARILTVEGFKAMYHADEANSAGDFEKAALSFSESATAFEQLHDYRVAAKARARAAHARSHAEQDGETRYRHLKEANALYAACADDLGYKATSDLLKEFSDEEAGVPARRMAVIHSHADVTQPTASAESQIAPAKKVGPYAVDLIGVGGMAEVYRAQSVGTTVAVKRLREDFVEKQEYIERFLREYETGRSLDHPNIVRVYERGDDAGVPYFTMEYLVGETLDAIMKPQRKLSPGDAAAIMKQVAEALAHAHVRGIIHRDLSPANIMVLADGTAKVMDFGVARNERFSGMTKSDEFLGTTQYASPEQLNLQPVTSASDLYTLGLISYEILTGTRALHARNRRSEDHPPPSRATSGIPPELDAIVSQLLVCDPAKRPTSRVVITELDAFLASVSSK